MRSVAESTEESQEFLVSEAGLANEVVKEAAPDGAMKWH
jgi:hypothetical protein